MRGTRKTERSKPPHWPQTLKQSRDGKDNAKTADQGRGSSAAMKRVVPLSQRLSLMINSQLKCWWCRSCDCLPSAGRPALAGKPPHCPGCLWGPAAFCPTFPQGCTASETKQIITLLVQNNACFSSKRKLTLFHSETTTKKTATAFNASVFSLWNTRLEQLPQKLSKLQLTVGKKMNLESFFVVYLYIVSARTRIEIQVNRRHKLRLRGVC